MSDEKLSLDGLIFECIEVGIDGHVMTLTLNRPERKNAINATMASELVYALDYAKQEHAIRVVVIAANGDVFCAGGDLRTMSGREGGGPQSNVPKRGEMNDVPMRLRHLYKPVVAKIQGSVLAGALLIVCNVTHAIAAEHAKFSAPEIKRGLWPFMVMAGLFRLLPKRVGMDFIMRGEAVDATTAANWGLINESVAANQLEKRVNEIVNDLASLAPGTMNMGLEAYVRQEDMEFEKAIPLLKENLDACLKSADAKEGITAFLEKREPNWD